MDELSLRVRTAAFREILSTGRPVGVGELADQRGRARRRFERPSGVS